MVVECGSTTNVPLGSGPSGNPIERSQDYFARRRNEATAATADVVVLVARNRAQGLVRCQVDHGSITLLEQVGDDVSESRLRMVPEVLVVERHLVARLLVLCARRWGF